MKLIEQHFKWLKNKALPIDGLCNALAKTKYLKTLDLFEPDFEKQSEYFGKKNYSVGYWASESDINGEFEGKFYSYKKLRQTIVLFICAMHGEI